MLLPLTLFISSCESDDDTTSSTLERTVLIYFAADNNLASLASADLAEIETGILSINSSSCRLLVYIDMGSDATLVEYSNDNGSVVKETIREYGDRNSAGVSEMSEVFNDVFANPDYQAESYGLVYWSHCDGWIPYPVPSTRWIGQDKGDGDNRMNLSEFVEILESAPHFDFIMFDACFMQSIEVAYELRNYTDYYIASPTETPGPGAPYDVILPSMFVNGAATEMSSLYFNTYAELYNEGVGISNKNWTGGVSICALRTSELENLAGVTSRLLSGVDADPSYLLESVFDYDQRSYYNGHIGYYDLYGMMQLLLDETDFTTWTQAYEAAIAYWNTTPKNYSSVVGMFSMEEANGVTQYIPASLESDAMEAYRSLSWYEAAGLSDAGW